MTESLPFVVFVAAVVGSVAVWASWYKMAIVIAQDQNDDKGSSARLFLVPLSSFGF